PDQAGYLAKLGYERIMEVKGRAHTDAWVSELEMLEGRLGPDECQSDSERMVVAAARLLSEKVRAKGYRAYLSGVGNSNLAAWLIDKHGNINSTIVPGVTYITGSGGANDIASSAREVVVTLAQRRNRFVDKVPYVTAPGRRVTTVVSDLGVYEKADAHAELVLSGVFAGRPEADAVRRAREACGWELKVAPAL